MNTASEIREMTHEIDVAARLAAEFVLDGDHKRALKYARRYKALLAEQTAANASRLLEIKARRLFGEA